MAVRPRPFAVASILRVFVDVTALVSAMKVPEIDPSGMVIVMDADAGAPVDALTSATAGRLLLIVMATPPAGAEHDGDR